MSNDNDCSYGNSTNPSSISRRRTLKIVSTFAALSGIPSVATADPPSSDSRQEREFPQDGWSPDGDVEPEQLTNKNRGQLIASIPNEAKQRINQADLFAPLTVLAAQQNNEKPTPSENGLSTYERIGEKDVRYRLTVNDAADLSNITQSHIHHAPDGASDNRLFVFLARFDTQLDGSGEGSPRDPPVTVEDTFSDIRITDDDPEVPIDNEVGDIDSDENLEAFIDDLFATPREYQNNVHTLEYQTEALRGEVLPANFGRLSRKELIFTVLATAGLDGLSGGPPFGKRRATKERRGTRGRGRRNRD